MEYPKREILRKPQLLHPMLAKATTCKNRLLWPFSTTVVITIAKIPGVAGLAGHKGLKTLFITVPHLLLPISFVI